MLAKEAGADAIDVSESIRSNPGFDLIYEKRSTRKPLGELALEYEAEIKKATDVYLTQPRNYLSPSLFSALSAVARIAGPDSEYWILDRLERHFPTAEAASLLEYMTLAGGFLPGQRIQPFVRNTVAFALSEPWNPHDRAYLVTQALVSVFFSDAPEFAIELLEGEVSWFFKSYQFRSLLGMLVWERSPMVDTWLERLLSSELESPDTRAAILDCHATRAWKRGDRAAVLTVAGRIVLDGANIMQNYAVRRMICEIASGDVDLCSQLLYRASLAQDINEAAGWLNFLMELETVEGVRVAFELADRFGEQLGVVSSMSPYVQEGTSLAFSGWFSGIKIRLRLGRVLYHLQDIIAKLHEFSASQDPVMSLAAERALLWIERERILAGTPPSGPRTVPPQSRSEPWQLRLH
jgi:hypothetical protein